MAKVWLITGAETDWDGTSPRGRCHGASRSSRSPRTKNWHLWWRSTEGGKP